MRHGFGARGALPSPAVKRLLLQLLGVSALLLAVLVGLGLGARGVLDLDTSSSVLLAGDARSSAAYERFTRLMGDRVPLALLVRHEAFFSDAGRDALASLGDALESLPVVNDVKSLTHSSRPVRRGGFSLRLSDMLANEPFLPSGEHDAAEWAALREQVLADPLARDVFVSGDGRWALVLAVAWGLHGAERVDSFAQAVEAVAREHEADFESVHRVGVPWIEREVAADVRRDAVFMLGAGALLMAAILLVAFRSLLVLLLMTVLGSTGLVGLPVLMAASGAGLNLYTAMLVPLVGGLQLTILAHLVSALEQGVQAGLGEPAALRRALRAVSGPSALAALTTMIGMASLRTCEVGLVRQFGTLGAGAVGLVLLVSLMPAWLLSWWRGPGAAPVAGERPPSPSPRAFAAVDAIARHRVAIVAAASALALASGFGLARLRTDLRAVEFLGPDSPARAALTTLDRDFGGLNAFQLEVDSGTPGGVHGRPVLTFLRELRRFGESRERVTHVYDLSQVYARLEALWQGDAGAGDELPATDFQLGLFTSLLAVVDVPLQDLLVDAEARRATVIVRAPDMPADEWLAQLDELMAFADTLRPPGVGLSLKAGVHELLEADRRLVASQVGSLGLCALAVLLVLALLLRSAVAALVVVGCNLLPVLAVLGLMGALGVPLNSITVMVGSLALGVSVDDAIHILWFRRHCAGDRRTRMAAALSAKLRPVAATSAVMIGGFALFLGSSFPPVAWFGLLGATAMLVALAAVLLLLPALLVGRRPE